MSSEVFKIFGTYELVDKVSSALESVSKKVGENSKEVVESGNIFTKLGGVIGSVASNIVGYVTSAFSLESITGFIKGCVEAANALELVQRKTKVIYGDMTSDVESWAMENERTFGLGSGTIQGYLNNIGDLAQGLGMGKQQSLEMAQGAMELGAQLANWNDIGTDEAMNDIQKAIMGSTKAVEKYGVKLNDTVLTEYTRKMGLGDSFSALDEATKAQVRYEAILGSSTNAVEYWNEGNRGMTFRLQEIKEQFGNITEVIGGFFLPMVQELLKVFGDVMTGLAQFSSLVGGAINSLIENLQNGQNFTDAFKTVFEEAFGISMPQGLTDFIGAVSSRFEEFRGTFESVWGIIKSNVLEPMLKTFGILGEYSGAIFQSIGDLFLVLFDYMNSVWKNFGLPLFDLFMDVVGLLWEKFNQYLPMIMNIWLEMVSVIKQLWEGVLKPVFDVIGSLLQNILLPIFKFVFTSSIIPIIDNCFSSIGYAWFNVLKPIFTGIIDFLQGVFTGNWSQVWNGVKNIFSGIFGGLTGIAKAPINAIIGMLNGLIGGLNKIQVPDWVPLLGGKGINIGSIPYLAQGTEYFKNNGNAIVGEYGQEMVQLPEGAKVINHRETRNNSDAEDNRPIEVSVVLDGKVIATAMSKYLSNSLGTRNRQVGFGGAY